MNVRQTIGWNVRNLRVAKGLSQERLALEAEIDRSYVGRIERGSENVTVATLESFAKVLGVPVRDLFNDVTNSGNIQPSLPSGRNVALARAGALARSGARQARPRLVIMASGDGMRPRKAV